MNDIATVMYHPLLNDMQLLLVVCSVCQIFTEFISNVAAANIILPFLAAYCTRYQRNPINFMFPAALSINMAFHTRIGTPGNAYVAGLINIPTKELLFAGIGPSIITLLTYWSTFPTYGVLFYENTTKPFTQWGNGVNDTTPT